MFRRVGDSILIETEAEISVFPASGHDSRVTAVSAMIAAGGPADARRVHLLRRINPQLRRRGNL